jgi:hypothetical protein
VKKAGHDADSRPVRHARSPALEVGVLQVADGALVEAQIVEVS